MSVRDALPITLLPAGTFVATSGASNPVGNLKGAVDLFLEIACIITPTVTAPWVHIQDSPGSQADTSSSSSVASLAVGAFGSANSLNNFVVVAVVGEASALFSAGNLTCSDNGSTPNSYSQIAFQQNAATSDFVAIFLAKITSLPSSGNLNPTVSCSGFTAYLSVCAAEFASGSLLADGSAQTGTGSVAAGSGIVTASLTISTAQAGDLLVGAIHTGDGMNPTGVTTPSGFAVIGAQTNDVQYASAQQCYEALSGIVNSQAVSWSFNRSGSQTNSWTAGIVAITPASFTLPTLDIYIQTSVDGGVTWQDIAHCQFTTAAATQFVQIRGGRQGQQNPFAAMTAQLPLGQVIQGPWGDTLRAQWVFSAGGSIGPYILSIQGFVK